MVASLELAVPASSRTITNFAQRFRVNLMESMQIPQPALPDTDTPLGTLIDSGHMSQRDFISFVFHRHDIDLETEASRNFDINLLGNSRMDADGSRMDARFTCLSIAREILHSKP